jgi:hypothetical protein
MTPEGNMVSLVLQQGDCNAPATYQALMNFLFSSYIGRFMDIYLDDIVIYSDTLEDHIKHVKLVIDILRREKLYLSKSKLRFIAPEMKLLGRVVDDEGIRMDAEKVDSVMKWKVPTNGDLLRGFIGAVGYLADDIPNIRIPMGILSSITGDTVPFRWGYTEQQVFEEVKKLVHLAREHHRVPLDYSEGASPIWMITDGCSTGISGLISQGEDWKNAKVAVFYSAKLNPAQQNYPVHEIEMLTGVETMLQNTDVLQGTKFKWLTDHKGLIYLLNQRICQVDKLDGSKRSVASLLMLYTLLVVKMCLQARYRESTQTIRLVLFEKKSEYTYHDVVDNDTSSVEHAPEILPILAGIASTTVPKRRPYIPKKAQPPARYFDAPPTSSTSTSGTQQSQLPTEDYPVPEEPVHAEASVVVSEPQPMDLVIHD